MKWFINQNTKIYGPYEEIELPARIHLLAADLDHSFVWSRGLPDWMTAKSWKPGLINKMQVLTPPLPPPSSKNNVNLMTEKPIAASKPILQNNKNFAKTFKVQYDFVEQKPMTIEELIQFTRTQEDVNKIAVYDSELKVWQEIYAIAEVSDQLGLSRRKNIRIPILAQFSGSNNKGLKFNSRIVTISIGGMGLSDTHDLAIGEAIRGQISSPHFFTPLSIEAEVTFSGNDGYIGLRFTQVNDDTLALITEYINRFNQN